MNSGEFKKNKLFYMNYIYILTSAERLLTHECTVQKYSLCQKHFDKLQCSPNSILEEFFFYLIKQILCNFY